MSGFLTRRQFLCASGLMAGYALLGLAVSARAQDAAPDGATEVTQDYSSGAYQKTVDQHVARNQRIIHVSITNQGDHVRYLATWGAADGPAWAARHGLSGAQLQTQLDDLASQGLRPMELCAYSLNSVARFGGLWERIDGLEWQVGRDLSPAAFANQDKTLTERGYLLVQICKYTVAGRPLVLGLWQK